MNSYLFNRETSLKSKTKRFLSALFPNFLKYGTLAGIILYIKNNLSQILSLYFDLSLEKEKASILSLQAQNAGKNFSLLSPSKIADYVSSLTSSAFAQAKLTSLEKTITLVNGLLGGILFIVLIWLTISFISATLKSYQEKEKENTLANLIVEKLLPYLDTKTK